MNLHCDLDLENNSYWVSWCSEPSQLLGIISRLTLKTTIHFFNKTFQFMIMYQQIIFGCKKISRSIDMVEAVISDHISPHCDIDLEDSKPIFLHDILANDGASLYQVWLQKVWQLRRYHPYEHSLEFLTFLVTLPLTATEQSNLFTRHQSKFSCKRISSSYNILKRHILIFIFWLYHP